MFCQQWNGGGGGGEGAARVGGRVQGDQKGRNFGVVGMQGELKHTLRS